MLAVAEPLTLVDAVARQHASEHIALIADGSPVTYAELVERIRRRCEEFDLSARSLVALSGANSLEFIVTYLALQADGHVPMLVSDHGGDATRRWLPNASITVRPDGWTLDQHHRRSFDLHPELALLLSTSGSTGSPKLVRLSHRNLVSNARAIAEFQELTDADRGITSLPMHYCFGLSVLHSHLMVGASLVVTNGSVVDPCFRAAMRDHEVTNLAGVPYTYELLHDLELDAPSLRLLAQAGGRLAPDLVTAWQRRAASVGAEFMVMYGQTEATARIAYLDPALTADHPGAIGKPVPGTRLRLDDVDERGVGELVVRGDHVMMGYATAVDDLASGHMLDELHTGDLARYHADVDAYEIVGRVSRLIKPFGVRIDLDHVEGLLRERFPNGQVAVVGDDESIVACAPHVHSGRLGDAVAHVTGLPKHAVTTIDRPIPRTPTGKVDQQALLGLRCPAEHISDSADVATTMSAVLGCGHVTSTDTFVSLGGDSLSYVECSIRLERMLGVLPPDWHLMTVAELSAAAAGTGADSTGRRYGRIDTTVLLRAIGICLVVCTHMRIQHLPGGAHTMLAVVGYNLARFMAPIDDARGRVVAGLRSASRAAIPAIIWVSVGMLVFGAYSVGTLVLVNNYVGPPEHVDDHWHFWFIEVFAHLVVLATLVLAVPAVRARERRWPFLAPLVVLAAALTLRMEWAQMGDWYNLRFRTHGVAWFFVLGWLIHQSVTTRQRLVATAACLLVVPGFFQHPTRDWMIASALVSLVWLRSVPMPRPMIRPLGWLAAASLWIYVTHFTVWPLLTEIFPVGVAYVGTIVVGVAVWFATERLLGLLNTWRQGRPNPQTTPLSPPLGGVA